MLNGTVFNHFSYHCQNKLAKYFDCCTLFKQIIKSSVMVEITNKTIDAY